MRLQVPMKEIQFSFARGSGPGGQNVNKVNSKAILRWDVVQSPSLDEEQKIRFFSRYGHRINADGIFVISSDKFRDQGRNVADCTQKLEAMLNAIARPPKVRKATKPTRASRQKRLESKRVRSERKKGRGRVRDW